MVEDVYEPLAEYRDNFRGRFHELAKNYFEKLVADSGLDVEANRKLAAKVLKLENEEATAKRKRFWLVVFMLLAGLAGSALGYFSYERFNAGDAAGGGKFAAGAVAAFAAAIPAFLRFLRIGENLRHLSRQIRAGKNLGYTRMERLNASYTWDIPVRLAAQTVPRLAFDPFFSAQRLDDLKRLFGWNDSFNEGKSMLGSQSGVINGNPFVIGDYLQMEWGEKTYTGTKSISWTERETDSQGRSRIVTRHQTLYASVTKPIPVYSEKRIVVYGNDAAPNLEFTRSPFGNTTGAVAGLKKWWRVKRLKSFSRNLTDDSNYTIMANHEFEALFCTKDRNDEVEFRLLFTALAQMQMLALIKDREVGFGDDFKFKKAGRINLVAADHLDHADLDTDPSRYRDWSVDSAALKFMRFNEEFFRHVYFALAPFLAIPLYQQTRTHEEIYKGVIPPNAKASFWECESAANYQGEQVFQHPASITRNILKTTRGQGGDVAVTAHGFRGENHTEYISKLGGDGNWHDVRVDWVEYLPVARTSQMFISEGTPPADVRNAAFRHSIYSWLSDPKT